MKTLFAVTLLVFVVSSAASGGDCRPVCKSCHTKDKVCT